MIAIINYGLGNLQSVKNALDFLNIPSMVVADPRNLEEAERIILPGVGAFGKGMENLHQAGFVQALNRHVIEQRKPFLGICLGMQLICQKSFEEGEFEGLGWIDAEVVRFKDNVLVPHVGWNDVDCNEKSPLFRGGAMQQTFYFVHSFYPNVVDGSLVTGWCEYGDRFAAAIEKENIFAVQFHPEKSQTEGLELLKRFSTC